MTPAMGNELFQTQQTSFPSEVPMKESIGDASEVEGLERGQGQ